jgi:hypothetical protein
MADEASDHIRIPDDHAEFKIVRERPVSQVTPLAGHHEPGRHGRRSAVAMPSAAVHVTNPLWPPPVGKKFEQSALHRGEPVAASARLSRPGADGSIKERVESARTCQRRSKIDPGITDLVI